MMALISEVTKEEIEIHLGRFAKSNLACVGENSWAIIQVNIDQPALNMSDMSHFVSLQDL